MEQELLEFCANNNIGVIPYSPMQEGLLTGKITKERVDGFPADDHRRRDPYFQEPKLSYTLDLVDGLKAVAEKSGRTVAQLSIAWVLRRPEITSAIVGATPSSDRGYSTCRGLEPVSGGDCWGRSASGTLRGSHTLE